MFIVSYEVLDVNDPEARVIGTESEEFDSEKEAIAFATEKLMEYGPCGVDRHVQIEQK